MERKLLLFTVILTVLINLFATFYIIDTAEIISLPTAKAFSANVSICINTPPEIVIPCNATLDQGTPYTCQLSYSDPNPGQNWTFSAFWPAAQVFSLPENGSISFTPSNDYIGSHSVVFSVDDGSGCLNSQVNETFEFEIVDVNDPPELIEPIPDIELVVNTTANPYSLTEYFRDPDGDEMTFSFTTPDFPFTVSLVDGVGVRVTANACEPEEVFIKFTATDPFNASAESNFVKLKVQCPDEEPGGTDSGGGGAGGGGAGGGTGGLCRSEWKCMDWFACLPTGYQWQHCFDLKGCEDPKFFKRECDYEGPQPVCEENWLCSEWTNCQPNGTQTRDCEDLNSCTSELFRPHEMQECLYIPTCNDGIQNGDETGVDCGGSCSACPVIETPSEISPERFNMWLLFALLTSLLLVSGVLRLYHEEFMRMLSRLDMMLSKHEEKEILLSREERNLFLEKIAKAERKCQENSSYAELAEQGRLLLATIAKLPEAFEKEELETALKNRKVAHLLINFYETIYSLEGTETAFSEVYAYSLSEEMRLIVAELSEGKPAELERPMKQFMIDETKSYLEEAFIRIVSIFRALQFEQYEFAKLEYDKLLATYEDLPEEDQEVMYDETRHVFETFKYAFERAK